MSSIETVSVPFANIIRSSEIPTNTSPVGQENKAQVTATDQPVLTEGTKYDTGKPRFDLVSPEWEEGLARVMAYGAVKYADRNWEKGIDVSRCYAALRRHLSAFICGEDIDPESGLPHLMHAQANLMFLWAMPKIHPERDDRAAIQIVRSVDKLNKANTSVLGWSIQEDRPV